MGWRDSSRPTWRPAPRKRATTGSAPTSGRYATAAAAPQATIPDKLRRAVSRLAPDETGINPQFDTFAGHYGVVIMPARVRQGRDRPLVESAVRLVYQRIYAPVRDRAA